MDGKPFVSIEHKNQIMIKPDFQNLRDDDFEKNVVSGPHSFPIEERQKEHWDVYNKDGQKLSIKKEPTSEFIKLLKKKSADKKDFK